MRRAVWRGHKKGVVEDLLKTGASAKDAEGSSTPLHFPARGGNSEIVRMLMLNEADNDAMDGSECTPSSFIWRNITVTWLLR